MLVSARQHQQNAQDYNITLQLKHQNFNMFQSFLSHLQVIHINYICTKCRYYLYSMKMTQRGSKMLKF